MMMQAMIKRRTAPLLPSKMIVKGVKVMSSRDVTSSPPSAGNENDK